MRPVPYSPLDPECPVWKEEVEALWADPITKASGVGGEVQSYMEQEHRKTCERCQNFGAANIE